MQRPYPREFRDDVGPVARNREHGVQIELIATDFDPNETEVHNTPNEAPRGGQKRAADSGSEDAGCSVVLTSRGEERSTLKGDTPNSVFCLPPALGTRRAARLRLEFAACLRLRRGAPRRIKSAGSRHSGGM